MSDEQRTDDEGHPNAADEHDEPLEDAVAEFEAHVQRTGNVRMDSPSNT